MTDKERFSEICSRPLVAEHKREGIGTYGEKSIHYALKLYFTDDEKCREVPVGKYIADVKCGSEIYEIQSSGFGAMKRKLEEYLYSDEITRVNLIYPIIANKKVIKFSPETGEIVKEYASPRHMKTAEIFKELLFLGEHLQSPKLSFILAVLSADELSLDTDGKRKKRGTTVKIDKIPKELVEFKYYESAYDMGDLFPFEDGETVVSSQIRKHLRASGRNGWAAIKVMEELGYLTRQGKDGNKILYLFTKYPRRGIENSK